MNQAELKAFMVFLQQKYGGPKREVANREPVTVKIPMFQKGPETDAFPQMPQVPQGFDPMMMGGMPGMDAMPGMMPPGMPGMPMQEPAMPGMDAMMPPGMDPRLLS